MNFKPAEANENLFQRWTSESGRWELGFYQVLFGVRVRFGIVGNDWVTLDYCAGDDVGFAMAFGAIPGECYRRADPP